MEQESCLNCSRAFKIVKWDYSNVHDNGVVKTELEGYCCMASQKEGIAIWMVGDGSEDMCEAWSPKEDRVDAE